MFSYFFALATVQSVEAKGCLKGAATGLGTLCSAIIRSSRIAGIQFGCLSFVPIYASCRTGAILRSRAAQ
jgi:hypothetical protein